MANMTRYEVQVTFTAGEHVTIWMRARGFNERHAVANLEAEMESYEGTTVHGNSVREAGCIYGCEDFADEDSRCQLCNDEAARDSRGTELRS